MRATNSSINVTLNSAYFVNAKVKNKTDPYLLL